MDKMTGLQSLVDKADSYTMSSGVRRRKFATQISKELNLWEPPVQSFVEEMRGLSFTSLEDRNLFVAFFHRAFSLMG